MSDRLGTAKWEDQSEVSRKYRYDFSNFWLGRANDQASIGYGDDRHICLVSGNRGGKGTSIIVNNLCFWPGSAVVVDPKGENASVTAARRGQGDAYCKGLGQAVHVLDPFNAATVDSCYRSAFNPLDALDPASEESIDEAGRLANAIVVVKDDKAEQFFDESARAMVKTLILHVLTCPDFMPAERTLLMVRDLLKRGDWQVAELRQQQAAAEGRASDEPDDPYFLLWTVVQANLAFDGLLAGDGTMFRSMLTTSPKTYSNVLQSALLHTEFLDSPGMRRVLARSDFKLSELKTRPEGMTLYLSLPQRYIATHHRWLRMMVVLTTTEMEATHGQPATGHRVLMILDEFAGLKRMDAIETAVAQIAGFGVKLFFVLQSLEQLKLVYKDGWETFLSNAGLKIFFSIEDHFTREYVSKLIGETEIVRYMQSENSGTSETDSHAAGTTRSTGVTDSESRSNSRAHGHSYTDTAGSSNNISTGRNSSENSSQTNSHSWGRSSSYTEGESQMSSSSFGTSESDSWQNFPVFPFMGQSSRTMGTSTSTGESWGTNRSRTEGENTGGGWSSSHGSSSGVSEGESRGWSNSTANGTSSTQTTGDSQTTGRSFTTGDSETVTRGTGRNFGTGRAETIHRRPLLRPEEVGKFFGRIDNRADPFYPGLALVLVAGGDPFLVRRMHYFEDPQFINCFSPHPDHKFLLAACFELTGARPLLDMLEVENGGKPLPISAWFVEWNEVVRSGRKLVRIDGVPPDGRSVAIRMPVTGKIVDFDNYVLRSKISNIGTAPLMTVKYYGALAAAIDPLAELRAACQDTINRRLARQREIEENIRVVRLDEERKRKNLELALIALVLFLVAVIVAGRLIWDYRAPLAAFFAMLWHAVIVTGESLIGLVVVVGLIWLIAQEFTDNRS